jgi:hypothetical protein
MNFKPTLNAVAFTGALLASACGASSQTGPAPESPPAPPNPGETSAIAQPAAAPSTGVQPAAAPAGAATSLTSPKSPPIDEGAVASATGGKPENTDGVVKVSFPRTDVPVEVATVKTAVDLTAWDGKAKAT